MKKLQSENKELELKVEEKEDQFLLAKHKSNLLAEKLKILSSMGKFNNITRNDIC